MKVEKTAGIVILLLLIALCAAEARVYALPAVTEKELMDLYLGIVEDAVSVFEPLWVDDSRRIPDSGFFDFRKYDDWTPSYKGYAGIITIPGNGLVDFCYAVLLTETDKPFFTAKKIPRSVLLDHALKSIRWCCLTSVYVKNRYSYIHEDTAPQFLEGKYWRREFGYRADEVGFLTLAAAKLWPKLDDETRQLVEDVMIGGAPTERLVRTWEPPQGGNQDQVKQDLSSTMGAAFLFPKRPDQKLYRDIVAGNGIDMVSTLHDFAKKTSADGKPVSEWAKGWNIYQDYTSDHHGWAQVWYGCDKLFEGWFYIDILSRITGIAVPQTYTYPGNGFEGILERMKILCLPEGDPASVHGMEYDSYYGSGLLAFLYGSVIKKDPVSAALEQRAAELLRKNSKAIPIYDYHRNNWAKAAVAYLTHKYRGPRAEPFPAVEAWNQLEGTYHHPWEQNLLHRSSNKLAAFSWGTISSKGDHFGGAGSGVCGFVIPARLCDPELEPLVYLHPFSMTGEITVTDTQGQARRGPLPADLYRFYRDDGYFHTAGRISVPPVEQRAAFYSFEDGPCVFFNTFKALESCTLSWSGISTYFYARPGMTGSRNFYDAHGERPLEKPYRSVSSWWDVEDRLGLALAEGAGDVEVVRTVGRNWARTDAYKDKCDTVYISGFKGRALRAGESCGDAAAVFFMETNHRFIEQAAKIIGKPGLYLPQDWKGVVVPEAKPGKKRYLAVANLGGKESEAVISLSFDEGAPLLSRPSLVSGKKSRTLLGLGDLDTYAETIDLYLENLGSEEVVAQKTALGQYIVKPGGSEKGKVKITCAAEPDSLIRITDLNGAPVKELRWSPRETAEGLTLDIGHGVVIRNTTEMDKDMMGPAVEIEAVNVREDRRVTIEVRAEDRSGLRSVRLFGDGQFVGELSNAPWVWNLRPGAGYHTFQALARDNSPRQNERKSDLRTVKVD